MKIEAQLIESFRHEKEGYKALIIGPKWQVAQLNFEPGLAPDSISKIDLHHCTDETFMLMSGQVVLIAAEKEKSGAMAFEVINMKPKVLYNIPKGCWHNVAMSQDAEVLITEDANTHEGDFEFYYLSEAEQRELKNLIGSVWND